MTAVKDSLLSMQGFIENRKITEEFPTFNPIFGARLHWRKPRYPICGFRTAASACRHLLSGALFSAGVRDDVGSLSSMCFPSSCGCLLYTSSNAVLAKAALPEAEIIIDAQCTASNDDTLHNKALDVMEGLQMTVINR